MNPDAAAANWPAALEPVSFGSSTTLVAAAFGSGQANGGLRAFIDSERRLFRLSVDSRGYENVAIPKT
jgi:hypothetical protein